MKSEIGKRVELIRKEMNMNKEEFSKMIGISGQYLGTIEHGINGLSTQRLMILCEKTGKTADYILFGKADPLTKDLQNLLSELDSNQLTYTTELLKNLILLIRS